MSRRVIAVDFDGTVALGHDGVGAGSFATAELNPHHPVIANVRELHYRGEFIVFYTARPPMCEEEIKLWLVAHNVPFDIIECSKMRYDFQLDDRTLNPVGLTAVEVFKVLFPGEEIVFKSEKVYK